MNERREQARQMRERGMTYRDIGAALGVSIERARQLALHVDDPEWEGLSPRVRDALKREGLTPAEALDMSDKQLLDIPNLGVVAVREVREWGADR